MAKTYGPAKAAEPSKPVDPDDDDTTSPDEYEKKLAAIESGQATTASYKNGTDYVPKTGLALLHKGEKVTPAKENMAEKKHNVSLYRALHHLNKGGLHRALKVPEGTPIPAAKLAAGKNSQNEHVRKMSQFAATMSSFKH